MLEFDVIVVTIVGCRMYGFAQHVIYLEEVVTCMRLGGTSTRHFAICTTVKSYLFAYNECSVRVIARLIDDTP